MKYPILLMSLFIGLTSSAQDLVQFHSEHMKQEFIDAGADLNGDGEVDVVEAAEVEELAFGNIIYAEFYEIQVGHNNNFYEYSQHISYSGCSDGFPDPSNEDWDDCGGVPGYNENDPPPVYDVNLQGLSSFTSLKHLGLGFPSYLDAIKVESLEIPPSTISLRVRDALDGILVLDQNSQLETLAFVPKDEQSGIDLSACLHLKQMYFSSESGTIILPSNSQPTYLVSYKDLDYGLLDLSQLDYLSLSKYDTGIDYNSLPAIRKLFLNEVNEGPMNISSPTLEEVSVSNSIHDIEIENCPNLKALSVYSGTITRIQNNPLLEMISVRNQYAPIYDELIIRDCEALSEMSFVKQKVERFEISNTPALSMVGISETTINELSLDTPNSLSHFAIRDNKNLTQLNIDFNNAEALRYLQLENTKMDELKVLDKPNFYRINLEDNQIGEIVLGGEALEDVYITGDYSAKLDFDESFDPINLRLDNQEIFNINDTGLERLNRMALADCTGDGLFKFSNCADLEWVYFKDTEINHIDLCNASDNLHLSFSYHNLSGQEFTLTIPDEVPVELCTNNLSLDIYNCNGVLVDFIDSEDTSTDIEELNASLSISPNPTTDYIYWNPQTSESETLVTVYNLNGKQVRSTQASAGNIFLGDLAPGVYLVNFQSDESTFSQRVLVQ